MVILMKKKITSLKILIFILLLVSGAYYLYMNNIFNRDISYPLVYGNIDVSIEADGFIIRDENDRLSAVQVSFELHEKNRERTSGYIIGKKRFFCHQRKS